MDGACHILATEHLDRPLDLPPVAEMEDVAERAAAIRSIGRFDHGQLAENRDQLGRLGQSRAVGDMDMVHGGAFTQITSGRSSTLPAFQNAALPYSTKRSPSLAKGGWTSKSARGMFMSDRSGPNRRSP